MMEGKTTMGNFFSLFKRKNDFKDEYEINVQLLLQYPALFDINKIHNNLKLFANDYFNKYPIKKKKYQGLNLALIKSAFSEQCIVKVVFVKNKIEFLSHEHKMFWMDSISELTGLSSKQISIHILDYDDERADFKRQEGQINALETFNKEMAKINNDMQETLAMMQKAREKSREESNLIDDILKKFNDDENKL